MNNSEMLEGMRKHLFDSKLVPIFNGREWVVMDYSTNEVCAESETYDKVLFLAFLALCQKLKERVVAKGYQAQVEANKLANFDQVVRERDRLKDIIIDILENPQIKLGEYTRLTYYRKLCDAGYKLLAIKFARNTWGLNLKDAKNLIESKCTLDTLVKTL